MKPLASSVLDMGVTGLNLGPAARFSELLPEGGGTLLIFLRHFGCIFCRQMITDVRRAAGSVTNFPPVIFFAQADAEEGRRFFSRRAPDARVVLDKSKQFYEAFGLKQGTVGQMFSLRVWGCGMAAAARGHMIGLPVGDPWQMPGIFLISSKEILWEHQFLHAGDHPDFEKIPGLLSELSGKSGVKGSGVGVG